MAFVRVIAVIVVGFLVFSFVGGAVAAMGLPPAIMLIVGGVASFFASRLVWRSFATKSEKMREFNKQDLKTYEEFLEQQYVRVERAMRRDQMEHGLRIRLAERKQEIEHEMMLLESLPGEYTVLDMNTPARQRLREPLGVE